jgi:hypothetical protein
LSQQSHPGIKDILKDGRQCALVTSLQRDDDLLYDTILAFTKMHLAAPALRWRAGTKQTSDRRPVMSAFGGKADIAVSERHVCF